MLLLTIRGPLYKLGSQSAQLSWPAAARSSCTKPAVQQACRDVEQARGRGHLTRVQRSTASHLTRDRMSLQIVHQHHIVSKPREIVTALEQHAARRSDTAAKGLQAACSIQAPRGTARARASKAPRGTTRLQPQVARLRVRSGCMKRTARRRRCTGCEPTEASGSVARKGVDVC